MLGIIKIICVIAVVFIIDYIIYRISLNRERKHDVECSGTELLFRDIPVSRYLPASTTRRGNNHRFISEVFPIDIVGKGIDLIKADGFNLHNTLEGE